MAKFFIWFVRVLAFATLFYDLVVVFLAYGLLWTIVAAVFFPITMFVAPIIAIATEPADGLPLLLSVVLLITWAIGHTIGGRKNSLETAPTIAVDREAELEHRRTQVESELRDAQRRLFVDLAPFLDEAIAVIETGVGDDASAQFREVMTILVPAFVRLNIPMPPQGSTPEEIYVRLLELRDWSEMGNLEDAQAPIDD